MMRRRPQHLFATVARVRALNASPRGIRPLSTPATLAAASLTDQPAEVIADYLLPLPSHQLATTLADLAGAGSVTTSSPTLQQPPPPLPQGHHLVYFAPQGGPATLTRDGAARSHSPGPPWTRRLWAGGAVSFRPGWRERLRLDGRPVCCRETVEQVRPLRERASVAVDVWRRYGVGHGSGSAAEDLPAGEAAAAWDIEERRTLIFLRPDGGEGQTAKSTQRQPSKFPHPPTSTLRVRPSAIHLFHFSALTYNAHAIHLDRDYARAHDGHRSLLVHGPLSLALVLRRLADACDDAVGRVRHLTYRNVAPLYVDEELTVCVRRPQQPRQPWDVWVERPDGGVAVRGSAEMEEE